MDYSWRPCSGLWRCVPSSRDIKQVRDVESVCRRERSIVVSKCHNGVVRNCSDTCADRILNTQLGSSVCLGCVSHHRSPTLYKGILPSGCAASGQQQRRIPFVCNEVS